MRKAVIYARVSSDAQRKEGTVQSQLAALRLQVKDAGDKLVREYVDDGVSGALLDRPAMNRLRDDLKGGDFEAVYVLNADRIARDVAYQTIIVGEILRRGKRLIVNGQDYVDNPENKFGLTVLGAVAEFERAKIAERSVRGRRHRLAQGRLLGHGSHLFGYAYTRRAPGTFPSFAINEREAKTVRWMFATYARGGVGIRTLARQLEKRGTKERNRLGQSQIKYILGNEAYLGTKWFNTMTADPNAPKKRHPKMVMRDRSEWVGVKIPAIVSVALFEKVRKRLERNRELFRNSKRTYLLSGLVTCGGCGKRCFAYRRSYRVTRKKVTAHVSYASYRCRTRGQHNPEIDVRVLDAAALEIAREVMTDASAMRPHVEALKKSAANAGAITEKALHGIDRKITDAKSAKNRVLDLYASGRLGREECVRRMRAYDELLRKLDEERKEVAGNVRVFRDPKLVEDSMRAFCTDARKKIAKCADDQSWRRFLEGRVETVKYVRVGKDAVKVSVAGRFAVRIGGGAFARFVVERTVSRKKQLEKSNLSEI